MYEVSICRQPHAVSAMVPGAMFEDGWITTFTSWYLLADT